MGDDVFVEAQLAAGADDASQLASAAGWSATEHSTSEATPAPTDASVEQASAMVGRAGLFGRGGHALVDAGEHPVTHALGPAGGHAAPSRVTRSGWAVNSSRQ